MNTLTYRVYVVERLVHGKWTPKELRVTNVRCVLRDITASGWNVNTYRVRRVNSEAEMCRILDLDVRASFATHRLTSDPSQLEWTS